MNPLPFLKWLFPSIIFLFISVVTSFTSNAQTGTGTIKATLADSSANELIFGAIMSCPEFPSIGAQSDLDGNIIIANIKPGTYNFKISYIGYKEITLTGIIVTAGQTTDLGKIYLDIDAEVTVIEIVGQAETNTEAAVVEEIRQSDNVVSGISAQQIQKSQDRDAGQIIQRIPGVTVVDGRFIQVRGLSERYNSVWMNGSSAPSIETDRKSFSFDLIPSAMVDRVLVFKTASPELPGDFAGGMVKVITRNSTEGRNLVVNYGMNYRAGTTFKQYSSDKTSFADALGFGAGSRNIPNIPTLTSNVSHADKLGYTKDFKNDWGIQNTTAMPDQRLSLLYNDKRVIGKNTFFAIGALNYSNVWTTYKIKRNFFDAGGNLTDKASDMQYTNNARLGVIANFDMVTPKGYKYSFRNFFNQTGRNQTIVRNLSDVNNTPTQRQYSLGYSARTLYTAQVAGDYSFKEDKTKLDWLLGFGYTHRNDPDLRRLGYSVQTNADGSQGYTAQVISGGTPPPLGGSRLYQDLRENVYTAAANYSHKFKIGNYKFTGNAGVYNEVKSRSFQARLLGYFYQDAAYYDTSLSHQGLGQIFSPGNVGTANGFIIGEDINNTYKYSASNVLAAQYVSFDLPIGEKIKIVGGVRHEFNVQSLQTKSATGSALNPSVKTSFFLPSVNASYNFNEKNLVRFAYGKTLNRPEFREWAPFTYYDFDFNVLNYGSLYLNPNNPLKVCTINNYDFRFEHYPSKSETVSFGVFYKDFNNPIESVVVPTTNLAYTFANAQHATSVGAEFEARKNLAFMEPLLKTRLVRNFSVVMNASLIKSKVTPTVGAPSWNPTRTMQGQSPYIINAGLYYQNDSATTQITVMYNVFGARIVYVGSTQYPDVVEMPRNTLDITIQQKLSKKVTATLGVNDLLNQRVLFVQDFNRDGYKRNGSDPALVDYRRGTYWFVGVQFKVL